jgi:betaine lipid synthase
MASLGGNVLSSELDNKIVYAGIAGVFCFALGLSRVFAGTRAEGNTAANDAPGLVRSLFLFAYGCFLKPHEGDGKGTQQDALESFYKAQAGIYDTTRSALLKGREDMLALVAAQLRAKSDVDRPDRPERVWVDVRPASFSPWDPVPSSD